MEKSNIEQDVDKRLKLRETVYTETFIHDVLYMAFYDKYFIYTYNSAKYIISITFQTDIDKKEIIKRVCEILNKLIPYTIKSFNYQNFFTVLEYSKSEYEIKL